MRLRGGLFSAEDVILLHLYSDFPKIRTAFPSIDKNKHSWLGYATYKKDNRLPTKRIDIYKIESMQLSPDSFEIKKHVRISDNLDFVDRSNLIKYHLKEDIPENLAELIKNAVRKDVNIHSHGRTYTNDSENKSKRQEITITGGKTEFVPICRTSRYNIDLTYGCISYMRKDGSYDPSLHCEYCYAYPRNSRPAIPYVLNPKKLEERILKEEIDVIRLGKKTEAGHLLHRHLLIKVVELGASHDVKFVLPTKYLEFDERVAAPFKETGSVIHYSLGYEELEHAANAWGCDSGFRIRNAIAYKESGVNVLIRLVTDVTKEPDNFVKDIFKLFEKYEIPTIVTPLKIRSKDVAKKTVDAGWHSLKNNRNQLSLGFFSDNGQNSHYSFKSGYLIPAELHSFYSERFRQNNEKCGGICGHIGSLVYSRGCGLFEGIIVDENEAKRTVFYTADKIYKRSKERDIYSRRMF